MSSTRVMDDPSPGFIEVCNDCECVVADNARHSRMCPAAAVETAAADYTELQVDTGWFTRPLTIVVNDRHGTHYLLDGRKDDTRVSLSSLDDVDKAAIKVLLQQALREIDPPRLTGGPITIHPARGGVFTDG